MGGQITWVRVRKCFVSVYSLKMACVCVCVYLFFFAIMTGLHETPQGCVL